MKEENTYNEYTGAKLPDYLRVNPFSVPEGYFGDLEKSTMLRVAEQQLKAEMADTGFAVPEGYFEGLAGRVQSRLFEETLKDQAADAGFVVPEGYFEENQAGINSRIAELKLKDEVSADGYHVPQGYFEGLAEQILSTARIEQLAPSQEHSFVVPQGYFETLSSRITDKVAQQSVVVSETSSVDTPVVRMPSKNKWSQYAAAAAVALIVSLGAYWAVDMSKQATSQANSTRIALHEISNEEIFGYLTQETEGVELIELATLLPEENVDRPFDIRERVDEQEIEEYLNYML